MSGYLKFLNRRDKFHPKVRLAVDAMTRCIIDIVVQKKGSVSLKSIEQITGLKNISVAFTADIIQYMAKDGIIEIKGGMVLGSVAKLTQIIEQAKTRLPDNHGKPWSEMDYVRLATMMLDMEPQAIIAAKLKRTESSVQMQTSLLRKAFRLIPYIEKHKVIRDFVSTPKSPNPLV